MSSRTVLAAAVILPLIAGCENGVPISPSTESPSFAPAPSPSKEVVLVDDDFSVRCDGGDVLAGHLGGFFQVMGESGGNLALNVFHLVFTFTNEAGETFVFNDVGPDRVYMKNGELFIAITGRSTATGIIGHVVLNLTTGETVLKAGKAFLPLEEQACEALT
jgi:hypothetical protein